MLRFRSPVRQWTRTYPNGQVTSFNWEPNTGDFRLKEISNLGAGNTALSQFEYVTDAVSRILTWKQQRGMDPKERLELEYNAGDELTSAVLKNDATSAIIWAENHCGGGAWKKFGRDGSPSGP